MVFGIIADLIASVTTILLPAYLSYKALRTSDPAQLTPWLIYFVVLALVLLAESWTLFIIGWIPFYSWLRLIFLSYLALPQTQGAKLLYLTYVEPFIVQHERDIDLFIGDMHQKLSTAGLGYLSRLIDFVREKILGQAAPSAAAYTAPMSGNVGGYAQSLLSRFTMPAARTNALGSASNVYGMLSGVAGAAMAGAAGAAGGRSRDISMTDVPSVPHFAIPEDMVNSSNADKSSYISAQREKLSVLMKALDKEQQTLDLAYGAPSGHRPNSSRGLDVDSHSHSGSSLTVKSKSEQSFENVEYEDAVNPLGPSKQANVGRRTTSGNWIPGVTAWFSSGSAATTPADERPASKGWSAAKEVTEAVQGMSSSIDTGR